MLKNDVDINKITNRLNNAINRAQLIDDRYDDLTDQISQLSDKVDHLYEKLVHNVKSFNYQKMAEINAKAFNGIVQTATARVQGARPFVNGYSWSTSPVRRLQSSPAC